MMRYKLFYSFLVLFIIAGCSSPQFSVKSDPPQADVYIVNTKNNEKKSLGKTPLTQKMSELRDSLGENLYTGDNFTVMVEKSGFKTETFKIPATRYATLLTSLEVKLKEDSKEKEREEETAKSLLNHLFLAQKLALEQQFERAQIELDKILETFPEFPRALSMRAAIFYAQKNYPESIKWYEQALKVDPQMDDVVKMIAKIKNQQTGQTNGEQEK